MSTKNEIKDFLIRFPFYLKHGFFTYVIKPIKNRMFAFQRWVVYSEQYGKDMKEKGRIMWEKAKQERERQR